MDTCFRCGRAGHWAKDCTSQPCPKCAVPLDWHTWQGLTECAWRGPACMNCGKPPHPDNAGPDRCERYTSPADTQADRGIRLRTPWLPYEMREPARSSGHCYSPPRRMPA